VPDPGSPPWAKPDPLAYGASADAAHFVAAPLLAAGAVALLGVVAADADKFRIPSVALLALTVATVLLVASVQFGFHARAVLYSASEVSDWWGEEAVAGDRDRRVAQQRADFDRWRFRIRRAVRAYNLGVTMLAVGVALSLVPPANLAAGPSAVRWVACGFAGLAALTEFAYTVTRR
jgi:hypothetical protein